MARYREYVAAQEKRKKKTRGSAPPGADQYWTRKVRAEYFAKPLSARKAILKAQASQLRLM